MQTSLSNNCKGHEKRDRLIISKTETNYQISQRNKSLTNWVNFIFKKLNAYIINFSTNLKSFEAISFFFEFQSFCVHYSFPIVSWLCFLISLYKAALCRTLASVCEAQLRVCVKLLICRRSLSAKFCATFQG